MKERIARHLIPVVLLAVVGLFTAPAARADDFDFEFNSDGVLPSAQGATFVGNVPESPVLFTVSGGLLHQDILSGPQYAVYEKIGAVNHHYDATLTWSSQLLASSGGPFGNSIAVFDSDPATYRMWLFGIQSDGIYQAQTTEQRLVSMDPTDRFHVYKIFIPHDSDAFDLYVDDVLRYSGTAYVNHVPNPNTATVYWGDETLHDEDARVDWDFVRFSNHAPATVPEPGFVQLSGLLACGAFALRRLRRRA